jgi:hypothetical protein
MFLAGRTRTSVGYDTGTRPLSHHAEGSLALVGEGSDEGAWASRRVGLSLRGMGLDHPVPILSTHSEYSLSDFPNEKIDRYYL